MSEMNREEWESLCDGCGWCCIIKFEDEDTGDIYYTNVVCHLLDLETVHCTAYDERTQRVPTCVNLTPQRAAEFVWLPETCAYRRLAEGKDLDAWHPLISGDPESVHKAGASIRGKVVSEKDVDPDELENYIEDDEDD